MSTSITDRFTDSTPWVPSIRVEGDPQPGLNPRVALRVGGPAPEGVGWTTSDDAVSFVSPVTVAAWRRVVLHVRH